MMDDTESDSDVADPLEIRTGTDYSRCYVCQGDDKASLKNPADSLNPKAAATAYKTAQTNIKYFLDNDVPLPYALKEEHINDNLDDKDEGIQNTLMKNKALVHTDCRLMLRKKYVDSELKKRKSTEPQEHAPSPKKTRSNLNASYSQIEPVCVKCHPKITDEPLHRCGSTDVSEKLEKWALESKDWAVHVKLQTCVNDACAADIYYHNSCYTELYTAARAAKKKGSGPEHLKSPYDNLVFSQLIAYIKYGPRQEPHKLADLKSKYLQKLEVENSEWKGQQLQSTRFKDAIMGKLGSDWQAYNSGKQVYIEHKTKIGEHLANVAQHQVSEEDASKIIEFGMIVRKYALLPQTPFDGSFKPNCLSEPVHRALLTAVDVIIEGSRSFCVKDAEEKIKNNAPLQENEETARINIGCSISQLIINGAVKRVSKAKQVKQMKERETPLTVYNALKSHLKRQTDRIKKDHSLGLSVSLDRVREIRKQMARVQTAYWQATGVVVPPTVTQGVFVTTSTDNVDIGGRFEFHGTLYTITAHPTKKNPGTKPKPLSLSSVPEEAEIKIPEKFSKVPLLEEGIECNLNLTSIPPGTIRMELDERHSIPKQEWIKHATDVIKSFKESADDPGTDTGLNKVPMTFGGFHSYNQSEGDIRPPASIGLFPEFYEKASSLEMQKHGMLMMAEATQHLNPGQTPVLEGDGPLYFIQKKLQVIYPEEVGFDKMVNFIGLLHMEMCDQEVGGKITGGSGWEDIFSISGVFTPGVCTSLLGGKHVKRTRHAYELTVLFNSIMKDRAWKAYQETVGPHLLKPDWEKRRDESCPTITFWNIVDKYMLSYFKFIRAQRIGDWMLTLGTIRDKLGWYFGLDRGLYQRITSWFLRDMALLPTSHPDIHAAFMDGMFSVQRSNTKFSLMALDQSHEHSVKFSKEDGGSRGLYYDPEEKEINEISRPEVLRAIKEFEDSICISPDDDKIKAHPESSAYAQKKLIKDVQAMVKAVDDGLISNPFMEENENEFVSISTGEIFDPEILKSLKNIKPEGDRQAKQFLESVMEKGEKSVLDTIPRNNFYTLQNRPPPVLPKERKATNSNPTATVIRYFMSIKDRPEQDKDDFFRHENLTCPPSLSDKGGIYHGSKSAITDCLPCMPNPGRNPLRMKATVAVFDMAAVINMLKPGLKTNTFEQFYHNDLKPYLMRNIGPDVTRIDCIFESYSQGNDSLKTALRIKRGGNFSRRTRVGAKIPIPKGVAWADFLKIPENKKPMFEFFSDVICEDFKDEKYLVCCTKGDTVLSNQDHDFSMISPCNQEEADTRMFRHLYQAGEEGHRVAYARTIDSDVVVNAVNMFPKTRLHELWIGYGKSNKYHDIPIHSNCSILGPSKCDALLIFNDFTGDDLVSAFKNVGKKSSWNAWTELGGNLTEAFIEMTNNPRCLSIDSPQMDIIQKFTVKMYDLRFKTNCATDKVNDARKYLFTTKQKPLEEMPPTLNALYQHTLRAVNAANYRSQAMVLNNPVTLPYSEFGYIRNERLNCWVPYWSDLPDNSKCVILKSCKCKVRCSGNCSCSRVPMRCTALCACKGNCINNENFD